MLKLSPRKLKPLFAPWSSFLLRLLFISINLPYSHVENAVVTSGLIPLIAIEMLDKLQKRICRTAGPSCAASFEPLGHFWNVASLFYSYYFGRCSSHQVLLSFSWGSSTRYSDRLHDISVTIPRCYKDVCQQFFSLHSQTPEFSVYRMLSFELWSK